MGSRALPAAGGGQGAASGRAGSQLGRKGFEQVYVQGRPDTGCAGESGVGDIRRRTCVPRAKRRAQWAVETCGGLRAQDVMVRGVIWRFGQCLLWEGLLERTVTGSGPECDAQPSLPSSLPGEGLTRLLPPPLPAGGAAAWALRGAGPPRVLTSMTRILFHSWNNTLSDWL